MEVRENDKMLRELTQVRVDRRVFHSRGFAEILKTLTSFV